MPLLLGAHTIDNGGIDMAARRAGAAGMSALQIFSAVPKYYNEKVGVKPERVARFRDALAREGGRRDEAPRREHRRRREHDGALLRGSRRDPRRRPRVAARTHRV